MTDDFDITSAFEGLELEEARELREKIVAAVSGTIQAHRAARAEPDNLDQAETAEIAALQQRVRGKNYVTEKHTIQARYAQLRNAQPAPVDEEIEAIADDPRALHALYQKRLAAIPRGTPMSLHYKRLIAAPFRAKGLNV